MMNWAGVVSRFELIDVGLCHRLNRSAHCRFIRRSFQIISRLGDGVVWYGLMLGLALLGGQRGVLTALTMVVAGLLSVTLYRWLKRGVVRPRPFHSHQHIHCHVPPLDQYSFPSGHTLHAVMFTMIACNSFPSLIIILAPLTLLIALSRLVLGVHYPSDVVVGALIGWALAAAAIRSSGLV